MAELEINHRKILSLQSAASSEVESISQSLPSLASGKVNQLEIGTGAKTIYYADSIAQLKELAWAVSSASFTLSGQCGECSPQSRQFADVFSTKLNVDVFAAYFSLLEEFHAASLKHRKCTASWKAELGGVKKLFDSSELIRTAKLTGGPYAALASLHKFTKPAFLTAFIDLAPPEGAKLLESYSAGDASVSIYLVPGAAEKYYLLTPPEVLLDLKTAQLANQTLEEISQREAQVVDPQSARSYFKDLASKALPGEQLAGKLADIIVRHSAGYGLLELLLADDNVQDIYVDSPGNAPVYIYHNKFEECITNISFTQHDLERLGSRLRALSGRPFDESSPVINTELPELGARVCGLCPPATFAGYGFAFRRHRPAPWTLAQFIAAKMIDARTAGLLSFLVDGQRSLLVTGPRGSGKSSLLSALIAEISPIYRMVVIEDTPELPIEALCSHGLKVQHMRIKSTLGSDTGGLELSAEDALRTALRLGESVLVIGEVRGPEAKSLFEAMRVGAAGNVVMGTIHGSSTYDTWDRIVNDLGVPSTSFKATDAVVSLASVRASDETKRNRKLVSVTEVKKHWRSDPFHENGFNNLVEYLPLGGNWKHADLKTEIIEDVAKLKKFTLKEAEQNIDCRAKIRELLVKKARQYGKASLLEAGATIDSNKQYAALVSRQIAEHGKVNYSELLASYAAWLEGYCRGKGA